MTLDAGRDGVVAPSRRPLLLFLHGLHGFTILDPAGISMDPANAAWPALGASHLAHASFRMSRTLSSELGWALVTRC